MAAEHAQLVSAIKLARTNAMSFAFVAKGSEGRLLMDKKKVPPKEIGDAKKACGGGTIYKGRCLFEDGTMVFEVPKEPPGTLAGLIRKIIKSDAAQTLNVIVRVNVALVETEKSETEMEPTVVSVAPAAPPLAPAPPPPDAGKAAVMKRLNALSDAIKAALAGPNQGQVKALFLTVNAAIKTQDFAQAAAALNNLEALLHVPAKEATVVPKGKVSVAVIAQEWRQVKLAAGEGMGLLEGALRATRNAEALRIAEIVHRLTADFPQSMEPLLDRLGKAYDAQDEGAMKTAKGDIQKEVTAWLAYLKNNAKYLEACEKNPWRIPVSVLEPLRRSLVSIQKQTT